MTAHKRRHTTQPFALCKLSYAHLRRYTYQHVYMVRHKMPFYDLHSFIRTQLLQYIFDTFLILIVYDFSSILWCEHDMVLA